MSVGRLRVERIAGQLFFDEAGVGLVVVEGADDIVAIWPSVEPELVLVVTVGVAVVDDVEPVTTPAFAIAGGGQEAVGGAADGGGQVLGSFLLEGSEFIGRGRQADQVEVQAAKDCARVGGGGGLQVLLLELRQDKAVDRVGGVTGGQGGLRQGLQ